jgi:Protein of unknown function (DUF541)
LRSIIATPRARVRSRTASCTVSGTRDRSPARIGIVREPLNRVVTAGATDAGNVSFLVSDASKMADQAREAAIADARRKAAIRAKAADVQCAEWIMEDKSNGPPVPMLARAQAAPLPIASAEDRLRAKVTVGFEIARVFDLEAASASGVQAFTCKKQRALRRIGQDIHDSRIDYRNEVLGSALGRPKSLR